MQSRQLDRTIEELEACIEGRLPLDVSGGTLKNSEIGYANGEVQPTDD